MLNTLGEVTKNNANIDNEVINNKLIFVFDFKHKFDDDLDNLHTPNWSDYEKF